ncbi:hypothetical protein J4Q44_G00325040 [Coregonus suidteri]|uniref:Uncharacterized protein n=1 Tax=Coregonus suidteri TaxID=861788 RepID=A0AAN8QNQ2_9TELE
MPASSHIAEVLEHWKRRWAARTESGVRRRTQAMSRSSSSKRKSRFSSLWVLDTTSKKKTKVHPHHQPGLC